MTGPDSEQSRNVAGQEIAEGTKKSQLAVAISEAISATEVERNNKVDAVIALLSGWDIVVDGEVPPAFVNKIKSQLLINPDDYLGVAENQHRATGDAVSEPVLYEEPIVEVKAEVDPIAELGTKIGNWYRRATATGPISVQSLRELAVDAAEIDRLIEELNYADPNNDERHQKIQQRKTLWRGLDKRREEIAGQIKYLENQEKLIVLDQQIDRFGQIVNNPAFQLSDKLSEFGDKLAAQLVAELLQRANGLTDSGELAKKLSTIEGIIAEKAFEQWRANLENNYPEILNLKQLTLVATTTLSSSNPDLTLADKLTASLLQARSKVKSVTSDKRYEEYLVANYWQPAEQAIQKMKDKQAEIEEIEKRKQQADKKQQEEKEVLDNLREEIAAMKRRGYYEFAVYSNNPFEKESGKIKDSIKRHKERLKNSPEIEAIRQEFLTVQFVVLKRTIITAIESYEFNDDGPSKVDEKNRDLFKPLLGDLKAICGEVDTADRKTRFAAEYQRFENEVNARVGFYIAARSIKNDELGITDRATSTEIAMQIPISQPVFFNGFNNEIVGNLLSGKITACADPELRYDEEVPLNRIIEKRKVKIFDTVSQRMVETETNITAWGEALRHFDLFFEGRVPEGVSSLEKESFESQRRKLYSLDSNEIYNIVTTYENARLQKLYEADLLASGARLGSNPPERTDEKYQIKISKKDALRAWNMSMVFMSPLELAPSSFDKPAPGYYALTVDYAIGEKSGSETGSTSAISSLVYFSIIGMCFPQLVTPENPVGVLHTFDLYENPERKSDGVIESVARAVHPHEIRDKMRTTLREKGFAADFDYLVDLPLLPIPPDGYSKMGNGAEKYRYHVFTTPLSNMLLRDSSGNVIRMLDSTGVPNDDYGIMTFNELIDENSKSQDNPNGSRMYEEMPFDKTRREDEEIKAWIGQAKNAEDFFKRILWTGETEFAESAVTKLMVEGNKTTKYATNVLQPWALEKREGFIKEEKLKMQIILTIMLIQGILKIAHGKSIEEVKQYYMKLDVGDERGREAVICCLEAGFSVPALAKNFVRQFADQIVQSMKLK